jgi:hypothetical protein
VTGDRQKPDGTIDDARDKFISRQGCRVTKTPDPVGVTHGRSHQYGYQYEYVGSEQRSLAF